MISGQYIRSLRIDSTLDASVFPYDLSSVRWIQKNGLELDKPVTFFVGENGSGKSTILEAIAVAWGFNAEGGSRNFNFSTMDTHSDLHNLATLVKGAKKPKDGYFLRAESWYNVSTNIEQLDADPYGGSKVSSYYGDKPLHSQSHGESFMSLISERLGGRGLYIFDEPEAALSPKRQLELLVQIDRLVKHDSQLIIATHSPILMAYPDAEIVYFDKDKLSKVGYKDTEHYLLSKDFLNDPASYLRRLL